MRAKFALIFCFVETGLRLIESDFLLHHLVVKAEIAVGADVAHLEVMAVYVGGEIMRPFDEGDGVFGIDLAVDDQLVGTFHSAVFHFVVKDFGGEENSVFDVSVRLS